MIGLASEQRAVARRHKSLLQKLKCHSDLTPKHALKFFQLEGWFPNDRKEIPAAALDYLAAQLEVSRGAFSHYDLRGRSWERDRAQTGLLDVLKETDLRVGFTDGFHSVSSREVLRREELQRRLLLSLYGLDTFATTGPRGTSSRGNRGL